MNVLIGLGNAFRRDDGAGLAVAGAARGRLGEGVRVIELDGDPARVIDAWAGATLAVVVDAVSSGAPPGTLHRLEEGTDRLPAGGSNPSSHGLGVTEAVALGRALGRLPDRLVVHGVEVEDVGEGPGLSTSVTTALPTLIDRVVAELTRTARSIEVTGTVQGVGFRPFVWRLAAEHGLCGWVRNVGGRVEICVEGDDRHVERFLVDLTAAAPPGATVDAVAVSVIDPTGCDGFTIAPSPGDGEASAGRAGRVPPDRAPCADCMAEQDDPADRRHGHPFLNCTACGPRFTIIDSFPYDRSRTSLAAFPLCAACAAEYADPSDRRFHAEAMACPACGPTACLLDAEGRPVGGEHDPVAAAGDLLRRGQILAVKGVGGWQLACDATDEAAVAELRTRKGRPDKPFAVMVGDLDVALDWFDPGPVERTALTSPAAPVVLVADRGRLAASVAPGHHRQGVLLPASPLHRLLARDAGRPLVLTSGNRSEEPIAVDDDDARQQLAGIADAFLGHDRPIVARYDDSVVVADRSGTTVLRRGRGCAPEPIALRAARDAPSVLAVGADLQNAFCFTCGNDAYLSAHVGDLDDDRTIAAWHDALARHRRLFGLDVDVVAHDRHPDLVSTRLAEAFAAETGRRLVAVQHHHAHVAAVVAEHGIDEPVLGVAFDGFGLGADGTAWGGELLLVDRAQSTRLGHLRPVPLPGSDLAVRHPVRMALVHADAAGRFDEALALLGLEPGRADALLGGARADELLAAARAGIAGPPTSSVGRLFDAVAALAGLGRGPTYEAHPALLLEQAATLAASPTPTEGRLVAPTVALLDGRLQVDAAPLVDAVVVALLDGVPVPVVAAGFHEALGRAIVEAVITLARDASVRRVVLAGGVFANRLLLRTIATGVTAAGLEPCWSRQAPPGDGGLALGQAFVARAALAGEDR